MKTISGWGRVPVVEAEEVLSEDLVRATETAVLCRGLGRSYGDASLPAVAGQRVVTTACADRILAFDRATGVVRAEAGLSLFALNTVLWPAGFAAPVSPGTQFVTLGGMVASDVHGKNQHVAGCFGNFVRSLRLRVASGRMLEIGPDREPDLFAATLGGMGLTGHILEVEFSAERVPSPWIYQETRALPNLEELIGALREASLQWPYTVGWVDCVRRGPGMGRGILHVGRFAEPAQLGRTRRPAPQPRSGPSLPLELPGFALNKFSIAAFNELYYRWHARPRSGIAHPQGFFYPLDFIQNWNRLYGRRGPVQYQCVLPDRAGPHFHRRFFDTLTRMGGASFLSVIKDCRAEPRGLLSFPMPGISVALDLVMHDAQTQRTIDALNEVVIEAGGRIYLTKDALTRPEHFRAMDGPRLERFLEVRRKWDPEARIRSALSVRLLGDAAT